MGVPILDKAGIRRLAAEGASAKRKSGDRPYIYMYDLPLSDAQLCFTANEEKAAWKLWNSDANARGDLVNIVVTSAENYKGLDFRNLFVNHIV